PRIRRSDYLIPTPRLGRSDYLIPIPRYGRHDSSKSRFGRSEVDKYPPLNIFASSVTLLNTELSWSMRSSDDGLCIHGEIFKCRCLFIFVENK
ncbi:hypothetical protein NPIL_546771, partial [Nephila pilipes]